jgi:hypothetical protein
MKYSVTVLIVGAVLVVGGITLGLGVTMMGIVRTFSSITESGQVPAQQIAEGTSNSVVASAIGIAAALLGVCLALGALICRYPRKK